MKHTDPDGERDPSNLFLLPECWLLTLVVFKVILWLLWLLQRPTAGNIGSALLVLDSLVLFAYIFLTPVLGLFYLHRYRAENVLVKSRGGNPIPFSMRFWTQTIVWLFLMGLVWVGILRALGGGVPYYVSVIEGPDTKYARAGFESLLKRPVPDHVRGVYFQSRNNIMDQHQILRFNTKDEEFIQSLIQEYELESELGGKVWDDKYKPGRPPSYTEVHRLGSFTLYYNRETGDTKFVWFTW